MGRNMYVMHVNDDVEDKGYHHGCMLSLIYALNYHHWQHHKKLLHHKNNHDASSHVKGNVDRHTSLLLHDPEQLEQFLIETENHQLDDDQKHNYTFPAKKRRSLKARIQSFISKDNKQQMGRKQNSSSSPRMLLRTHSIHHQEPSDRDPGEVGIVSPKTDENSEKLSHSLPNFNRKKKLIKSGSFPTVDMSPRRKLRPSKLEDKKNEVWHNFDDHSMNRKAVIHRRCSSLTESVERYAKLFESSSGQEIKLQLSRSLKLRNEYDLPSSGNVSFRRIQSLSQSDNWWPFQNEELETVNQDNPVVDEIQYDQVDKTGDRTDDLQILENRENRINGFTTDQRLDSISEAVLVEEIGPAYSQVLEKPDEAEPNNIIFQNSESRKTDYDDDMKYMIEILDQSGLCWDSIDQLSTINPSVLKKVEDQWHNKLVLSLEEAFFSCPHHELLFDLINEELVEFQKIGGVESFSHRARPLRVGTGVKDEVIGRVSKILNRKPDRYQTLDDIVAQDLEQDDGWMNHQLENESVVLDIEGMIFDEIFEDILCT